MPRIMDRYRRWKVIDTIGYIFFLISDASHKSMMHAEEWNAILWNYLKISNIR